MDPRHIVQPWEFQILYNLKIAHLIFLLIKGSPTKELSESSPKKDKDKEKKKKGGIKAPSFLKSKKKHKKEKEKEKKEKGASEM